MKRSEICSSNFPTAAPVENYRRELNLDTAVARVTYTSGGVKFKREIFSSPVDQVIVVRLTADQPGQISFTAGMNTPQKVEVNAEVSTNGPFVGKTNGATLVMRGVNGEASGIRGALKFRSASVRAGAMSRANIGGCGQNFRHQCRFGHIAHRRRDEL